MRSGDGNIYCSRTIYTLVLFYSLALDASEYLISYRYQVKNATLYNEILQISKTMQKCNGKVIDSLILDNKNKNNLKDIISNNSQEFIDFIHKLGLEVQPKSNTLASVIAALLAIFKTASSAFDLPKKLSLFCFIFVLDDNDFVTS